MKTSKERLSMYIATIPGMTIAEVERRCGFSQRYLTRVSASIDCDRLAIIKKEFPNVSLDWIVCGVMPMCVTPTEPAHQVTQNNTIGDNQYYIDHRDPIIKTLSTSLEHAQKEADDLREYIKTLLPVLRKIMES